jgi:hypothetical protein
MNRNFDPQKIKALAIDLDGTTLLPDTTLGERTRIYLKKLISKGKQIIITTGRTPDSSVCYADAIGAHGPMVFFNGAEVVDLPSGNVVSISLVDNDIMDYCIDIARSLGVFFQIYLPPGVSPDTGEIDTSINQRTLIIEKPGSEADLYHKHTNIIPVVKDLKSVISQPGLKGCIKGMFIADPVFHDEIRAKMTERFGERISITRSFPTFLEILNAGISKGEGLKIAMLHRGLKPEEVIAFGDEENDLSMFPVAGFACAPQSAREKIRNAADLIYGPIEKEGLAIWLEKTFL